MKIIALLFSFVVSAASVMTWASESPDTFWLGADISGTTELEAQGVQLYNAAGEPRENTQLMHELGLNAVRLRVWVNPQQGFCSPHDVLVMGQGLGHGDHDRFPL